MMNLQTSERTQCSLLSQAWFQLADQWTDGISAREYCRFLQGVFNAMTTIDSSGKRVFKDDRDIKIYDPFKGMISEAKLDRIMEIFNCKGTTGMSKRSINEAGRDLENPPSVIMNWEEESEFYESFFLLALNIHNLL